MAETQVPLYPTSQQSPILPQYSEVVQNIQPVIAFVPSADEKVINYRWASLKVSSIECVNITNQTFYTENETAIVNGLAVNLFGKLKSADIEINIKLPYNIPQDIIAARVFSDTSLSTEETFVELGYLIHSNEKNSEVQMSSTQTCTIVLPLMRGIPQHKPLLDKISLSGKSLIHFTFTFAGIELSSLKNESWRIRVVASPLEPKIECSSISKYAIDVPRIKESWKNFKLYCKGVVKSFASKSKSHSTNQIASAPTTA